MKNLITTQMNEVRKQRGRYKTQFDFNIKINSFYKDRPNRKSEKVLGFNKIDGLLLNGEIVFDK